MITRSDPFREALSLRRAMDQLFEQSFVQPSLLPSASVQMAAMDVCETPNGYEVDIALPGARPEDIEVTVDLNTLTIRGRYSHQEEHQRQGELQDGGKAAQQQGKTQRHRQGHNWLLREIPTGTFERTISFSRPIDTNTIQTKFENGILTIMLPVSEESRPKRLSIAGGQQPQMTAGGQSQQPQVTVGAGQQQRS
jgi:HSP20 family protein